MKIDVFSHVLPKRYLNALTKKAPQGFDFTKIAVWSTKQNAPLIDMDIRLRLHERTPDVLQVLTLGAPPLETVVRGKNIIDLARLANDEMAELRLKYPNLFTGVAACVPLTSIDAALKELDRTVKGMDFKGVQIFTHVNGEPLSSPRLRPLFEKMARLDMPIWIHPWSHPERPVREPFGWPMETSLTMLDLVSSGIFIEFPDLKFIIHHCGAMIPFFIDRIRTTWMRSISKQESVNVNDPLPHFRKFYVDTAVYGNTAALMCGHDIFGTEHMLFGTDAPLGAGDGEHGLTLKTIQSIERMAIPDAEKEMIFADNALKLLKIDL
jgi:predicted TIM-barrel fold metal-dependent hydrolase